MILFVCKCFTITLATFLVAWSSCRLKGIRLRQWRTCECQWALSSVRSKLKLLPGFGTNWINFNYNYRFDIVKHKWIIIATFIGEVSSHAWVLLFPFAIAYCYCLLLLPTATVHCIAIVCSYCQSLQCCCVVWCLLLLLLLLLIATACCSCIIQLPVISAYCYCLLLLPIAIAYFDCLLRLPSDDISMTTVIAYCYCLLC